MNIKKAYYTAFKFVDKHLPTILSGVSALGVFATAYFSFANASTIIEKKNQIKFRDDTKDEDREIIVDILKDSIPIALSVAITIGGIVGADCINRKRIRGLAKAYSILQNNYREYALAAATALGAETNNKIKENLDRNKIKKDKRTNMPNNTYKFVDRYTRKTFISTLEDVIAAQYVLNRLFCLRGIATLDEYCKLIGIGVVDDAQLLGWDISVGQNWYGYEWIDFINERHEDEDGTVWYSIEMVFKPTPEGAYCFEDLCIKEDEYIEYLMDDKQSLLG